MNNILWHLILFCNIANVTYTSMLLFSGILLKQEYSAGLKILTIYVALKLGSSKQGKACLACVVWNCVEASHLKPLNVNFDVCLVLFILLFGKLNF